LVLAQLSQADGVHTLDLPRPDVSIPGAEGAYPDDAYGEQEFYDDEGWGYAS